MKPGRAGTKKKSPPHQDAGVLLPEADGTLVVTTWIPLIDTAEETGGLQAYPRLHQGEKSPVRGHLATV